MFLIRELVIFIVGGTAYQGIEILWRGATHPSMFFAGGACLLAISCISGIIGQRSLPLTTVLCGTVITVIELAVGTVVNVIMGLNVWDYSDVPYNFMGQICPTYTAMWILISIPAVFICKYIDKIARSIFKNNNRAKERN